MMAEPPHLFCAGAGYSALTLARLLVAEGWTVSGSTREADHAADLAAVGVRPVVWTLPLVLPLSILDSADTLLVSVPPDTSGCPALAGLEPFLARFRRLRYVVYYSSTGVYGDAGGAWIDETYPLMARTSRGEARITAEAGWGKAARAHGFDLYILRLSGIYGPGRNAMASLLRQRRKPAGSADNPTGTGRRIYKKGQYFNRIHVADIAGATAHLLQRLQDNAPPSAHIFNLADNLPCPPQEAVSYAAQLLGLEEPPLVPLEEAELSPMARSFYADSKKLRNDRLREDLNYKLQYPTYREGLQSLLDACKEPA